MGESMNLKDHYGMTTMLRTFLLIELQKLLTPNQRDYLDPTKKGNYYDRFGSIER